jgi:hypothetical protein
MITYNYYCCIHFILKQTSRHVAYFQTGGESTLQMLMKCSGSAPYVLALLSQQTYKKLHLEYAGWPFSASGFSAVSFCYPLKF